MQNLFLYEVFMTSFLELKSAAYFFAMRMGTKDRSIRWVLKAKALHEFLL